MLGKHLLMASIAVVSSALFVGLAVLGWGGFGAFFAHPPFITIFVIYVLLLGAAMFTQGNLNPGEREDRGNRWVIWAIMGLSIALAYVPAYTDRIGLWTLDGEAMRWTGVVLVAIGGTLRVLPVFVLGRRFSASRSRRSTGL
jgi:protein-S-isoprenylcysteine O-methyltransferase Ste14